MKRLSPLVFLLTLILLASCRPSAPKPVTPPPAQPQAELTLTTSAPATATSTELTLGPATTTTASSNVATTTVSPAATLPPAPLLGPVQTQTDSSTVTATSSAPVVVTPPPSAKATVIRLLAPEGQISDGVKQELTAKLGLDVQITTYHTNDEAAQKLTAPGAVYNLALISYRLVPHLIAEQKLSPLPTLTITKQPAPKYLHHFFDRENKYSLPYAFSLAGIAVRAADVKTPVSQWSQLFNEAHYKVAHLPEDAALESTLLAKAGLRNSSLTPAAATAAKEESVDPIQVDSISNLKKTFATQPGWRFVLPGEGSVIFLYCAVVPATNPAPDQAPALLEEFFNPEVTTRIAEENYLGVTQPAAFKLLPPASTSDTLIYPPDRILNSCVFIRSGFRPIPTP